jgi:beta-glucosidase-like glycosyl hydrolase
MPMHANHELLTGALRTVFGFGDGLCASDAGDVSGVAGA